MSSPPSNNPHYKDSSCTSLHDADLWSLLQEFDISLPADDDRNPLKWIDPIRFEHENLAMALYSSKDTGFTGDNPSSAIVLELESQANMEKGCIGGKTNLKTSERNRRIKHSQAKKALLQHNSDQPSSSTVLKKENHNAKERVRRLQLNASYLALRWLLPDARRSKVDYSSQHLH